jgi:FlaA1/EpsC-like NDP-sugar epimerase
LFEELSIKGEDMQPTRHPKIGIWKNIPVNHDKIQAGVNRLVDVAKRQDYAKIAEQIKGLVPEFTGDNWRNAAESYEHSN